MRPFFLPGGIQNQIQIIHHAKSRPYSQERGDFRKNNGRVSDEQPMYVHCNWACASLACISGTLAFKAWWGGIIFMLGGIFDQKVQVPPPKTKMDTQNDGLERVTPFKHGNFWYLC